jgi:3-hydroxyisobutyrate dehydrogenase-like beta-hydroxyacid dehydrogenase
MIRASWGFGESEPCERVRSVGLPTDGSLADLIPGMIVAGLGQGIGFTTMYVAASTGVPQGKEGVASAMAMTAQQLGGSIGLALLVALLTERCSRSAFALVRRLGLETENVALHDSPIVSPWQAAKLQRIAEGEYSPRFALSLALKDVHLALQAADDDGFIALASVPRGAQHAVDEGLGDQDLTVVTTILGDPTHV